MIYFERHKELLTRLLKQLYAEEELAGNLCFTGPSALMLFHGLPRFSKDLDFSLADDKAAKTVFKKARKVVQSFGHLRDEALREDRIIMVLDAGANEWDVKLDVSLPGFGEEQETQTLAETPVRVMTPPDMLTHLLCSLSEKTIISNQTIFDTNYLMQQQVPLNPRLIQARADTKPGALLERCRQVVERQPDNRILNGLGELLDLETRNHARRHLKQETIQLIEKYREQAAATS